MKNEEIDKLDFNNWPLPNNILVEIGRVSALWNVLETLLTLCIGKLSGYDIKDPRSFILIVHSSFPQKLDILSSLCDYCLFPKCWDSPSVKNRTNISEIELLKYLQPKIFKVLVPVSHSLNDTYLIVQPFSECV
jgi:hypothetical protein